jgi:hypothetical protein
LFCARAIYFFQCEGREIRKRILSRDKKIRARREEEQEEEEEEEDYG